MLAEQLGLERLKRFVAIGIAPPDRVFVARLNRLIQLLGLPAPHDYLSVPVVLGTRGGIGLLIGPLGLFMLNIRRHPEHGDRAQKAMDHGLIWLLFFTSLTGLALLA